MTDASLFAKTHSRTDNVETSLAAAASVEGVATQQCESIYAELRKSPWPLAGEQIADILGMTTHAVGKRLPDLEHQGVIRKTLFRHTNRSGRRAVKWKICKPFTLEG